MRYELLSSRMLREYPIFTTVLQLLNLGLKDQYKDGVQKLGFSIEDLLDKERDAALGNGGLGRLAACYLDSSASQVRYQALPTDIQSCSFSHRNCQFGATD